MAGQRRATLLLVCQPLRLIRQQERAHGRSDWRPAGPVTMHRLEVQLILLNVRDDGMNRAHTVNAALHDLAVFSHVLPDDEESANDHSLGTLSDLAEPTQSANNAPCWT